MASAPLLLLQAKALIFLLPFSLPLTGLFLATLFSLLPAPPTRLVILRLLRWPATPSTLTTQNIMTIRVTFSFLLLLNARAICTPHLLVLSTLLWRNAPASLYNQAPNLEFTIPLVTQLLTCLHRFSKLPPFR